MIFRDLPIGVRRKGENFGRLVRYGIVRSFINKINMNGGNQNGI